MSIYCTTVTGLAIFAARKNLIVDDTQFDANGVGIDFTGYTFAGEVRAAVDPTSTKFGDLVITADASGNISAHLTAAVSSACVAGAIDEKVYFDIKGHAGADEDENWYAGWLATSNVVTA